MVDKRCASILRMSEDKTVEFISLYAKEECLWKTDSEFYTNKTARSIATQKIAEAINLPEFEPKHVMMKFKNLRNAYCQELKKMAASIELGGEHRPRLVWFNLMDSFLRNYLKKPRFDEEIEQKLNEQIDENFTNNSIKKNMNNLNNNVTNIANNNLPNIPVVLVNPVPYKEEGWYIIENPPEIHEPVEEIFNEEDFSTITTNDILIEPVNKRPREDDCIDPLLLNKDYFDDFGQYISSLLRALPLKKAMALQPQIINLITSSALDEDSILN